MILNCNNSEITCPTVLIWSYEGDNGWGNISNKVTPNHFISPLDYDGLLRLYPDLD